MRQRVHKPVSPEAARFGQWISQRREDKFGWTQAELGSRADMATASLSHMENGLRRPMGKSLRQLAPALRLSYDTLRSVLDGKKLDPMMDDPTFQPSSSPHSRPSLAIPDDIRPALDAYAADNGLSVSDAMLDLVSQALELQRLRVYTHRVTDGSRRTPEAAQMPRERQRQ
jgi:transcriptional regulator with XRE-family HTH domain